MRLFKSFKAQWRATSLLCALLLGISLAPKSTFVAAQANPVDPATLTGRQQSQAITDQLVANGRIIRPNEVKRGMRGYGLSVFQGTKIEKFSIEVLGVLEKVRGGGDIVLIKVLDGPVVERQSGIIAGMSGSPVYINGKMLGAIALGWGFPKEPIGGVTPITEMIYSSLPQDMGAPKVANAVSDKSADIYAPRETLDIKGQRISRVVVPRSHSKASLNAAEKEQKRHKNTAMMRPTSTLLQISGFSDATMPELKKILEPYGFEPFASPAGGKKNVPSPKLEPGSAVGVQLVTGDMDQTAVGTVTFRWGNRILGFGHPMLGQGNASLPMTSSYIEDIFPSYQRSFKLASPIKAVGAIQQDTQFAIGGTLGVKPKMVPVSVKLVDAERQIDKTFNVQVLKDAQLTPQLIPAVAQQAIDTAFGSIADKMVKVSMRMDVAGTNPIERQNLIYAPSKITQAGLADLVQSIALMQGNPFEKGDIQHVALEISVASKRDVASIKSMSVDHNKLKPGDSFQVKVTMESAANPKERIYKTFDFTVPANARKGVMRVAAASGANYWALLSVVGGPAPTFSNLPELVTAWNKVGALNELTIAASMPQRYLRVGEQDAVNPPPSWQKLLTPKMAGEAKAYNDVDVHSTKLDHAVDGAMILAIPIEEGDADATDTETTEDSDNGGSSATEDDTDSSDEAKSDNKSTFIGGYSWASVSNWSKKSWKELMKPLADPPLIDKDKESSEDKKKDTKKEETKTESTGTATPTTSTTSTTETTPKTISKTLGRPALNWVDSGATEFLKGKFEGTLVDSDGIIRNAPTSRQLSALTLPFIWSIASDSAQNVYLGSGAEDQAILYRVNTAGEREAIFETAGIAVTALTTDQENNIYAAVSPGGKIYRIAPNGNATSVYDTEQSFVWALKWDSDGRLLVGTGGENGKLFRLALAGDKSTFVGSVLHDFADEHVRGIAVGADKTIYVGTSAAGTLYKVNPASGEATALYETTATGGAHNGEITAVETLGNDVYFGTSSNGTLYRWTAQEGVTSLYPSPQNAVYALQKAGDDGLFMATGNKGIVYRLKPGKDAQTTKGARFLEPIQLQSLALSVDQVGNRLLIGTGNNAAAYEIPLRNEEKGTYTSRVYDAKNVVRWGSVRVTGQNLYIQTRSGNTSIPDETWSNWETVQSLEKGGLRIASPNSRFLQYQVTLQNGAKPGILARIAISFLPPNQPPQLAITAPEGGEYWNEEQSVTWTGADPDKDTLRYRITLIDGQSERHSVGDKPLKESPYSLDTSKYDDGSYQLEIQASDVVSNPIDAQTATKITLPFTIDNTAPVIMNARIETENGKRYVRADVSDKLSPVVGVEWRLIPAESEDDAEDRQADEESAVETSDENREEKEEEPAEETTSESDDEYDEDADDDSEDNDWFALAAEDGIFDSLYERVVGILPSNISETQRIELRAHDAAGNIVTLKIDIPKE